MTQDGTGTRVTCLPMAAPAIVVVIPAHNEASRLPAVLRELGEHTGDLVRATVVVDDGSRDDTAEVARKAGAVVTRHALNLGKGSALLTGCELALRLGAGIIVTMDADGQHRPADLPALVAPLIAGDADVVLGARRFGDQMPALFRFGNRLLSGCLRAFYGLEVADSQSGYRALTASAFKAVRWSSRGYAVESEMLVHMARARLRCVEVPIPAIYHERYKGTQPLDGLMIVGQLVRWRLS